jgi:hypothetical protein
MNEQNRPPIIDRREAYLRAAAILVLPALVAGGVYASGKPTELDNSGPSNDLLNGEGISLADQHKQQADEYTITDGRSIFAYKLAAKTEGLTAEQIGKAEPSLSALSFEDPTNEFNLPLLPKTVTPTTIPNNQDFSLPRIAPESSAPSSAQQKNTVEATPTATPEAAPLSDEDTQRSAIVSVLKTELSKNVVESPIGSNSSPEIDKYTAGIPDSWCASFVSWVMKQTGHTFSGGSRISSKYPDWDIIRVNGGSNDSLVGHFVNKGTYRDINVGTMKPGDPYFDKVTTVDPSTGKVEVSEHTGIAISPPDPVSGNYDGIEGNFSSKVSLVHRSIKTPMTYGHTTERIYGYGSVFTEPSVKTAPPARPSVPVPQSTVAATPTSTVAAPAKLGNTSEYLADGLGNGGFVLPVIPESTLPTPTPTTEMTKPPIAAGVGGSNPNAGVTATTQSPERSSIKANVMENVPDAYRELFIKAAASAHIPPELLTAIFVTEHGNRWPNPNGPWATSGSAAFGPFQFLRPTWDAYKIDGDGDGSADIQSVADSAYAAAAYLAGNGAKIDAPLGDPKNLQFGTMCYTAGTYNAGGGTMQQHVKPGVNVDNTGLLPEAKTYIKNVWNLVESGFVHGVPGYGGAAGIVKNNIS